MLAGPGALRKLTDPHGHVPYAAAETGRLPSSPMPAEERQALARAHRLWTRGLWAIGLSFLVAALAITLSIARAPGVAEHFLGQSTQQTATVTHIQEVSFCTRSNRDLYTLEWQEGAAHRSETVGRCGNPWQVGDVVEIWSTRGEPQTSGPTALWLSFGALIAGFAVATACVWRNRQRVRRAAAAAIAGTWQPFTFPTVGRPGEPEFRVEAPEPVRHRRRDWRINIYSDTPVALTPAIPGTLYVDGVTGGRPRGMSLHTTADGDRVWRWHP